jgi:translocation and assembly module TamB
VDYRDGTFDYKLEGKTLGGTFDLEGQIPSADAVQKESKKGRLRIENVAIARLTEALNLQDTLPLTGRLSIELDYTHATPNRQPKGTGRLRIASLRMRGTRLATEVESELQLSDGLLRLREIGGEIAQGTFGASLTYNFNEPTRSRFTLALDNVEASQLLAPWLGDRIKGPLSARVRASLGAEWRGTVDLELARGDVLGLEVTQWRLPAEWTYAPSTGRSQLDIYESSATVARGRIVGKATLFWDTSLRIEGNLRFSGVDVQTLLRQTMGSSQLGGGQMTGRFEFAGSNVGSVNDLNGNLVAAFSQAQALQLPILRQVAPYVGMGPSTTFQRGELRARLDRGVFRIQQLALEGGKLQLHVEGTASLEGRLNLSVVAKTGEVGAPGAVRVIASRIPIAGPVPQLVLQEASGLLASRVINLEVTGTTHSPVIRLRPLPLLTDEVVRFFLSRSNSPIPLAP